MGELWNSIETWIQTQTPEIFGIKSGYYLILLGIIILTFIIRWLLVNIIVKALEKFTSKTKTELDDLIIAAIKKPIGWIIVAFGLLIAYMVFSSAIRPNEQELRQNLRPVVIERMTEDLKETLGEENPALSDAELQALVQSEIDDEFRLRVNEELDEEVQNNLQQFKNINDIVYNIFVTILILCISWLLWSLINNIALFFAKKAEETESKLDDQIVPIARKFFKILIISVAAGIVLSNFGINVTGLIAGLGIFGFAFAIAAQDTIGNMFGSATLFGSKPFQIGDFVIFGSIEGIVEEIGLRTTKIRKFDRHLVIIPNADLAKGVIENVSGRGTTYRMREIIGLTYGSSPEQIEEFCEEVRNMILAHDFTNKDSYYVHFTNYGDSSLNILIQCFFECEGGFPQFLKAKQEFLVDVMRLVNRMGLEFAFPSMTLYKYDNDMQQDSNKNRELFAKFLRMKRDRQRKEQLRKIKESEMSPEEKEEKAKHELKEKEEHINELKSQLKKEEEEADTIKKELYGEEDNRSEDEKKVDEGLQKGGESVEED
jgi:MscS family membrane protein